MSAIKKPRRPKPQGLLFTSTPPKRNPDTSPSSPTSQTRKTVKTRILILSDTHGHASLPAPLPADLSLDLVLHCGDLSTCGSLEDYHATQTLLSSLPAPLKLVIPGNHDLTLDHKFWSTHATDAGAGLYSEARDLWTGKEARENGIVLLDDGLHTLTLQNGARLTLYTSSAASYPSNTQAQNWAFGHKSNEDRYNPPETGISYSKSVGTARTLIEDEREREVDVMMTHAPPKYRLDRTEEGDSVGYPHLFRAVRRCRPRVHCFEYVHAGYGCEVARWKNGRGEVLPGDDDEDGVRGVRGVEGDGRVVEVAGWGGEETVFVNGALMGDEALERMPWVLEMGLETVDLGGEKVES